jgi:hypothetical protein
VEQVSNGMRTLRNTEIISNCRRIWYGSVATGTAESFTVLRRVLWLWPKFVDANRKSSELLSDELN